MAIWPLNCVRTIAENEGKEFAGFTEDAIRALQAYDWPSNIRELKNVIEHAAIVTPEDQWITPDVLFDQKDTDIFQGTFDDQVEQFKKKIIQDALTRAQGNITHAAEMLSMERSKLSRRAKKYGLTEKAS